MFPKVDTRDPVAVATRIRELLRPLEASPDFTFIDRIFKEVGDMFQGKSEDFQPIDLKYHDYQHTLQASLCMAELLEGRHRAGATPAYSWRHVELGMAAVLLHDTGYLKTKSDRSGTGAKYTYTHVLRSVAFAASQLPRFGVSRAEIEIVLGGIRCTGPTAKISDQNYHGTRDLLLGCCVATADYLGQMAASDYPDELEILFNEFRESDDYQGLPPQDRMFKSADDLISKTPGFWQFVVLPKLQNDFRGVYRYLADSFPHGRNNYVEAVEQNIERIKSRAVNLTSPLTIA